MKPNLALLVLLAVACSTAPKETEWKYYTSERTTYSEGKYKFEKEYCRTRGDEKECFIERCEGNTCTKEGNEEIKTISASFKPAPKPEKEVEAEQINYQKNCDDGDINACIHIYFGYDSADGSKAGFRKTPPGFLKNKICKKPGMICRFTELDSVYPAPSGFDTRITRSHQEHNLLKETIDTDDALAVLIVKQIKTDPKFFKDAKWKPWPTIKYPSKVSIEPASGESHFLKNVQIFTQRRADKTSYDVNILFQEIVKR